jgi:hypothetical protein
MPAAARRAVPEARVLPLEAIAPHLVALAASDAPHPRARA